jgi:hypothetical protein
MAGTLVITTLSDGTSSTSATDIVNGSARAWVNFDGTGTPAIRASYNVSSITDNGTGNYTVNFTTAMIDVNYAAVITSDLASDGSVIVANTNDYLTARTTSAIRVGCAQPGVGAKDTTHFQVSIFR